MHTGQVITGVLPAHSGTSPRLNYREVRCPASDLLCKEQSIWLEQHLLLGSTADAEDIAIAFEKIYEHREVLKDSALLAGG